MANVESFFNSEAESVCTEDECPITESEILWFEAAPDDDDDDVLGDSDVEQALPERLRGGDDDELDDDLDEKRRTGTLGRSKSEELQTGLQQPTSLLMRILNIVKIAVLIVVWAICTACLMLGKERDNDVKFLSIPVGVPKYFRVPDIEYESSLGFTLIGPFAIQDEIRNAQEDEREYLILQVERALYSADDKLVKATPISEQWDLKLGQLKPQKNIKKEKVLKMQIGSAELAQDEEIHIKFTSNTKQQFSTKFILDDSPVDHHKGILYGSLILLGLYAAILWDLINRTFAAIVASTMAIGALGVLGTRPSLPTIMKWVDVETMVLLFAMMILVAVLSESGIFDYLAVFAYKITKGQVWPMVNCLCFFTAALSTFLDNVTMMLLVTPVTIRLCEVTDLNPVPILMSMVVYSNIGAALTPVGDPPNVLITTNAFIAESGVHFGLFVVHMLPAVLLGCVSTYVQLRYIQYRKIDSLRFPHSPEVEELKREIGVWEHLAATIGALSADEEDVRGTILKKVARLKKVLKEKISSSRKEVSFDETLKYLEDEYPIRNKMLLYKSGVAFTFVIVCFCLHSVPNFVHLSLGWSALLGAIMALILADIDDMQAIMARIEWSTLLFFAGLLILMEALTELGLIEVIGNFAINAVLSVEPQHRLLFALFIILWLTALSSAFLDNIPVTTMMIKIIISLSENKELNLPLHPLVWALAVGACFGGNGTLIGASANVVSAGVAGQHGYKITFMQFLLVGLPVVFVSVTIANLYLFVVHVLYQWH